MKSSDIQIRAISQEMPQPSITKICLKITCLKFHSNFPGANELKSDIPEHSVILTFLSCWLFSVVSVMLGIWNRGQPRFFENWDSKDPSHHFQFDINQSLQCQTYVNTLRLRQNGCHFSDDIFKCIFFNENIWTWIKISLKFVPKCPINNIQHCFR